MPTMDIRNLIQKRFENSDMHLYAKDGQKVSPLLIQNEYQSIKTYLLKNHSDPKDIIALKLEKDYRYLLCILAAFEVGVPYIPMKFDYPEHRVKQIQEESQFSLLINEQNIQKILGTKAENLPLPTRDSTHPLYVIFTSGSTGKPKGVVIPRQAWSNFLHWLDNYFPEVTANTHMLQVTEFTFDISFVDVGLFILRNPHTHFSNFNQDIFTLAFELETYKINFLSTVPNNLNMILNDAVIERVDLAALKTLIIAGARFSLGLYQKCQKHLPLSRIINAYGPTECTVYSHAKDFDFKNDCEETILSIGKELPHVKGHIVKDGSFAPPLERGELVLSGVQMMSGYMNDPEKTKNAFIEIDGKFYYRTGDIAFMRKDGDTFVTGRNDDTIKYRSFRINLLDIDSYIHKLNYVEDCVTVAIENENLDMQTIAFLKLKTEKSVKEIKADLLQYLLDYQIPEKMIFVKDYPVNTSGKVDKNVLKKEYLVSKEGSL